MNSFAEIFELMTKQLNVTDVAYNLWIKPIKPVKLDNNKIVLFVESPYNKKIIEENYLSRFETIFKDILGFDVVIDIQTGNTNYSDGNQKISEPIPELDDDFDMRERLDKAVENGEYKHTFDTFIVGSSNKLAYAAAKAVAQKQSGKYNPLFIYGDSGLGKTHLLSAVSNEILKTYPNSNVLYVTAEGFTNEFIQAIGDQTTDRFHEKYRKADVLLVDDIQFIAGKTQTEEEFFYTFNELHSSGRQIVLTSDRPPREIKSIADRLKTRFEWGLIADIQAPDFETRVAIIKRKAELLNFNLSSEVIDFIATKLKNNIRQLEGAIIKMNALTLVTGIAPTIITAQNTIRDIMSDHQPIPVTVDKIISEVAHIYNVTPEEIRSQKRSSQISTARQVAIFVVQEITGLSYSNIGEEFGKRDHSTIVYAINKVKSIIKKDSSYKSTIDDLIKNMQSNQM